MKLPSPEPGTLQVLDDDDVVHVYRITRADYGVYEKDGIHWITFSLRADEKLSPEDGENPEPWLEINLPFPEPPHSKLESGQTIQGEAYDEAFGGWLTNMYYYSHDGFESPVISIEESAASHVLALIEGESSAGPANLRARFVENPQRRRSCS